MMIKRRNHLVLAGIFGMGLLLAAGCVDTGANKHNTVPDQAPDANSSNGKPKAPEPIAASPWTNSLGHVLVPVPGTKVLFSVYDTRVRDYAAFASAAKVTDKAWQNPQAVGMPVTPSEDCPVVNVSWNDAKAFCQWLTDKERAAGLITKNQFYRLPTDVEWSVASGLHEPEAGTPTEKDCVITNAYPWGTHMPPTPGSGNYEDETVKGVFDGWNYIEGYNDGFATTSPVGSFKPNQFGLYDMGGNVSQMCEDWYDDAHQWRVARGAAWDQCSNDGLLLSHRARSAPTYGSIELGFRCVLASSFAP